MNIDVKTYRNDMRNKLYFHCCSSLIFDFYGSNFQIASNNNNENIGTF